jgi:hypothetical protein
MVELLEKLFRANLISAFLAMSLAASGCNVQGEREEDACPETVDVESRVEHFVAVESLAAAADMPNAPREEFIADIVEENSVKRWVKREWIRKSRIGFRDGKVIVDFGVIFVDFDQPTADGTYALRNLRGRICEARVRGGPSLDCTGFDAELIVAETRAPGGAGEERPLFVARLLTKAPDEDALPKNAFAFGHARLLHRETRRSACAPERQ